MVKKYSIVTSIISSIFILTHHNELPVEDLVYTNSPFLFIESLSFTKPTSKDPLFPPIPDGSLFQYPLSPSLRYFTISLESRIESIKKNIKDGQDRLAETEKELEMKKLSK